MRKSNEMIRFFVVSFRLSRYGIPKSRVFQLASVKFSRQREKKEEERGGTICDAPTSKKTTRRKKECRSSALSLSFSSLHSAPLRPHPLAVSLLKNAFTEHSSSSNFSSGSYFSSYLSLPCKRSISFAPIHPPTYLPSMQLRFCSSHFLSERTGKSPRLTVEELSCQRLEKLAEAE